MDNKTVSILVCIVYFACLIGAGIYGMLKNKKASDYLVAGRKLNLLLTTATLAAVQIGAGIILGGAETGATWGIWPGMYYALGCGGGLILAGILVAHRMRDEEGYVPMDIFEKRFGQNKWVRIWAWLSNVPSMLGIFVAQMLACGSILAGFGVPFGTGVLMCSIVILIYSSIGGMWGVVLGDFVQIAIMTVGIPVAAVASLLKLSATGISPMSIYNTPFIPDGLFTKFIYLVVPFLLAISVSYDAFMRYQSAKDAKTARLGCILAGIFVIIFGIFASTIGAVARIIFPEMEEGLFAAMVMNSLHPVAAGIVLAAVLAAAMSSGNCLLISM